MKNTVVSALVAMAALGMAGSASAATTVLTPGDLAPKPPAPPTIPAPGDWGYDNPYGWDWDEDAPLGSTTVGGAPGYAGSSWYSDVQGGGPAGPGRHYTSLRINVQGMFDSPSVTMGDLEEISYWTNLESGTVDWQLKIYTAENSPGTGSSWYGHRFNFNTPSFAAGSGWNASSTNSNLATNWITDGATSDYTTRTLSYLATNFATEQILFIDIIAGYATSGPSVYSYLDGVSLTVGGVTHDLNLEAAVVPLPGAAALGFLGMGLIGLRRRFQKAQTIA